MARAAATAATRPSAASGSNSQRWLNLVRTAEGTNKNNSYGTAFSGARFDNSKPHPGKIYTSKSGYKSAAHGAYQFMPDTWKEINGGKNVPMTQANQDKAALALMRKAGVDPNQPMTKEALAKLSGTWASLPNAEGKSAYSQPVKSYEELQQAWDSYNPKAGMKINKKGEQGHFNPNSVGKMGPTYKPNSSVGNPVVAPMKVGPKSSAAADFLSTPDFLQDNSYRSSPANQSFKGGLPSLADVAQAGIANYSHFKNKSNSYGQAAFSRPNSSYSNINNRSYGGGMNLGSSLGIRYSNPSAGSSYGASAFGMSPSTVNSINSYSYGYK